MPRKRSAHWRIEVHQRDEVVFRQRVPGNLSNKKIEEILRRLYCAQLEPREIVSASMKGNTLLDIRVDGPPRSKRPMLWIESNSDYMASHWKADEATEPDILGLD